MEINGSGNVVGNGNSVNNNINTESPDKSGRSSSSERIKFDDEALRKLEEVERRRKDSKIFCYHCKDETRQDNLFEELEITQPKEVLLFDDLGNYKNSVWTINGRIWKITKCRGCEFINLNVYIRHDPFKDDVRVHHFPTKDFRQFPTWVKHLDRKFVDLICEIYLSLNVGNTKLPLMGARTLLDIYIVDKVGDIGTFKQKLQKLVDENHISSDSKNLLEVALEYGHATIHRGHEPNSDQINGVLDIIENLLRTEALKNSTSELKKSAPKKK